jgi:hypothetical protein
MGNNLATGATGTASRNTTTEQWNNKGQQQQWATDNNRQPEQPGNRATDNWATGNGTMEQLEHGTMERHGAIDGRQQGNRNNRQQSNGQQEQLEQ